MSTTQGGQWVAVSAMAVLVAAVASLGALLPTSAVAGGSTTWLQAIEQGEDHIGAEALAAELMAGRGDVVVVDVRPAAEFATWHLPGARNLTVPEVTGEAGKAIFAAKPRLVVLCSNGPAHPAQAWVELRRQGRTEVKVLDGGLDEFKAKVLTPPSLQGADEAKAKAAAPLFALRRAFFLGDAKPNALAAWATDPPELQAPTMVSTRWLGDRLGKVAVLDARERAEDYAALHLPGALHLPVASLRQKVGDRELYLLPAAELAARFGALGLTRTTPVVLYADDKQQDATLLVMALLRVGHQRLAILEGGLLRWAAERRPLVVEVPKPTPATYEAAAGADTFTVDADAVHQAVQGGVAVLDVRPPEFFKGEKSTEARPGHIPGAVNRLFSKDLLRTDDGNWLRPKAELEREYAALGLQKDRPVVVSCRTGHTASESWFVLRYLLGYQDVRWFNGSWTEWAARQDLPAATGDGKAGR